MHLTEGDDTGRISVHNTAQSPGGEIYEANGEAYCPDPDFPAELIVEINCNIFLLILKHET